MNSAHSNFTEELTDFFFFPAMGFNLVDNAAMVWADLDKF